MTTDIISLKLVVLGDSGVGKSSLVLRYVDDSFNENLTATVGVDYKTKIITINDKKIKLDIWDTAGEEKFRALTPVFYRKAHGAVLVYDVDNETSFTRIEDWLSEFNTHVTEENAVIMIIGNKTDLATKKISSKDGRSLAKKHGTLFLEVSAKNSSCVSDAFNELVEKILEMSDLKERNVDTLNLGNNVGDSYSFTCTGYKCNIPPLFLW